MMPGHRALPRLLRVGAGLALVLLWMKAVGLATELMLGLGLWFFLGLVKVPLSFALWCAATDPKSYFGLALTLALAAVYGPLRRLLVLPWPRWAGRPWLVPVAAVFAAGQACGDACDQPQPANRFGFYSGLTPDQTLTIKGLPGSAQPDCTARINSLGFRGRGWTVPAEPGVRRALLVGDSMVWGAGIQNEEDMLDRQLERELGRRDRRRWQVLNIATSPAALWYYVHALVAVGREARPELYIMSFLSYYDLEPWEAQRVKTGLSPRLVAMMVRLGVVKKLHHVGAALTDRYARRERVDPAVFADLRREFRTLVAFIEKTGGRLIIWEPFRPNPSGFFDEYLHHPQITFVNWQDVPDLPERLRGRPQSGAVPWQEDETLSFKGDGHPTPAGNALFAKAIAVKALAALGPASAARRSGYPRIPNIGL